jgi:hypothetical protein
MLKENFCDLGSLQIIIRKIELSGMSCAAVSELKYPYKVSRPLGKNRILRCGLDLFGLG